MRPAVKRRLVTLAAAASLLMCIATLALWVRSYWRIDGIGLRYVADKAVRTWGMISVVGDVGFAVGTQPHVSSPKSSWIHETDLTRSGMTMHNFLERSNGSPHDPRSSGWFLGFGFVFYDGPQPWVGMRSIAVPHWFLAPLFAFLPAFHLRAAVRSRHRGRAGLCLQCGYDVRATPHRCPECGAVATPYRFLRTPAVSPRVQRSPIMRQT
jgi:hypothetical protein